MIVWMIILVASLINLPINIAILLTGVTSIFDRYPELRSSTIEVPDCKAAMNAFCRMMPAKAN